MNSFVVNFTNDVKIVYNLIEHRVVDTWMNSIVQMTPDNLCDRNHYCGIADKNHLKLRISRLYELATILNQHVENKITVTEITEKNWKDTLNVMHVHFPELMANSSDQFLKSIASEYNDHIHWLETALATYSWHALSTNVDTKYFRITFDFNKSTNTRHKFELDDFSNFTPMMLFGNLYLHYCHVGRHAYELLINKDLHCPKNQFVPQTEFSPSVRLCFYDPIMGEDKLADLWKKFYELKGGKSYWGMDMDDPRMALGYFKIGEISEIYIEGQLVNYNYNCVINRNGIRDKLINTKVISWKILTT